MSRRVYNINDLKQLAHFKEISQVYGNQILKLAHHLFTEPFKEHHSGIKGVSDARISERGAELVFEGKLVDICLGEDNYPIRFGGKNEPPLRINFSGDTKNWQQIDDVYFLFHNSVRENESSLYERVIGSKEKQSKVLESIKKLAKKQRKPII